MFRNTNEYIAIDKGTSETKNKTLTRDGRLPTWKGLYWSSILRCLARLNIIKMRHLASSRLISSGTSRVPLVSPPKLIPRMCPLLAGLDPSKSEICCHDHPIQPSLVYQRQELHHLLHSVGARPLQPLGIAHGDLINVACHIRLHLWHVEPSLRPILHICVQCGHDVLANHPVPKLQVRTAYDPRSRSRPGFQAEEVAEEIKMRKNAKISFIEMDEDRDMKDGIQA